MAYTVLIVDDSETIRAAMVRAFGMARLPMQEVLQAGNGREALELLKTHWVDMVFTDINMPSMGGEELIRNMKEDVELCDIPVAVISSEAARPRIEALQEAGIAGYLRKPCRPEEIRDILHAVLGEWK